MSKLFPQRAIPSTISAFGNCPITNDDVVTFTAFHPVYKPAFGNSMWKPIYGYSMHFFSLSLS